MFGNRSFIAAENTGVQLREAVQTEQLPRDMTEKSSAMSAAFSFADQEQKEKHDDKDASDPLGRCGGRRMTGRLAGILIDDFVKDIGVAPIGFSVPVPVKHAGSPFAKHSVGALFFGRSLSLFRPCPVRYAPSNPGEGRTPRGNARRRR